MSAFRLPPPQPGRRSSSSGRAVQRTSSRTPVDAVGERVHEVEQAVVGPLQVLEDEHEPGRARRAPRRSGARPRTPRSTRSSARSASPPSPTSGRRWPVDPAASPPRPDQVGRRTAAASPRPRRRRRTRGSRPAPSPSRRAPRRRRRSPYGRRAPLPPGDQLPILVHDPEQLPDEPALADPRHADERDELRLRAPPAPGRARRAAGRAPRRAPDERGAARPGQVDAVARAGLHRLPDGNRLGLPLRLDRRRVAVLDRALGRPVGDARPRGSRPPAPPTGAERPC